MSLSTTGKRLTAALAVVLGAAAAVTSVPAQAAAQPAGEVSASAVGCRPNAVWDPVAHNDGQLFALTPDRSAVYHGIMQVDGTPTLQWRKIGGPASNLIAGRAGVFATNPQTGDIYRFALLDGTWSRIGGPGAQFVTADTHLYALTPDRSKVMEYKGNDGPTPWVQVGGPAKELYGGPAGLLATNPQTGDVYAFLNAPFQWRKIGGPGYSFAVGHGHFYGRNAGGVFEHVSGETWRQIGGPAGALYASTYGLFATNPSTGDIYCYTDTPNAWVKAGGPGTQFVAGRNRLFGLNGGGVFMWNGAGTAWTQVGGPAAQIAAN